MTKSLPFLYSSGDPTGDICIDISDAGKKNTTLPLPTGATAQPVHFISLKFQAGYLKNKLAYS